MAIIHFNNVERTFRQGNQDFVALKGINLEVGDREFVAIVGPSGCGKTTCMRMAAGLEHPTGGNVMVDSEVVTRPGPDRAVVFQQFALFPWKTVWDRLRVAVYVFGWLNTEPTACPRALSYTCRYALVKRSCGSTLARALP